MALDIEAWQVSNSVFPASGTRSAHASERPLAAGCGFYAGHQLRTQASVLASPLLEDFPVPKKILP